MANEINPQILQFLVDNAKNLSDLSDKNPNTYFPDYDQYSTGLANYPINIKQLMNNFIRQEGLAKQTPQLSKKETQQLIKDISKSLNDIRANNMLNVIPNYNSNIIG